VPYLSALEVCSRQGAIQIHVYYLTEREPAKTPPPPVLSTEITATQALELLASVSAKTHVSDSEFVVQPVSTPQPQALNQFFQ